MRVDDSSPERLSFIDDPDASILHAYAGTAAMLQVREHEQPRPSGLSRRDPAVGPAGTAAIGTLGVACYRLGKMEGAPHARNCPWANPWNVAPSHTTLPRRIVMPGQARSVMPS